MLSQAEIIKALQFARFYDSDPLNSTGAPRLEITYQYAGTQQPGDLPTDTTYSGWRDFTTAEKANFEAALAHIESFLNVEFTEVSGEDDPDINVGAVTLSGNTSGYGGYGVSYYDTTITEWDGFVVFDESRDLSSADAMNLLLHELGHAMGLRHTRPGRQPAGGIRQQPLFHHVLHYQPDQRPGQRCDDAVRRPGAAGHLGLSRLQHRRHPLHRIAHQYR
ncbi:matrixin family metalloprotease [Phaeobacter sp. SYSU ZJ3003]|uniref:matrixin family metalloprotease n=1 Tax=Phaeobacter sp. SYSU ZJ3003 TaxID=2109330 RepID=UPI00351CB4ED